MEGRDIGTAVFPDAPVKIFLTADPATRGARRLEERGDHRVDVAVAVHARDAKDAHVSRPNGSAGVVVIDTTDLSAAATLERAIAIVRERLP